MGWRTRTSTSGTSSSSHFKTKYYRSTDECESDAVSCCGGAAKWISPFLTTRASDDLKTCVLKLWFSSRMYMMSRDGGSLWGCDNCDWAEMISRIISPYRSSDWWCKAFKLNQKRKLCTFSLPTVLFFFFCSCVVVPSFLFEQGLFVLFLLTRKLPEQQCNDSLHTDNQYFLYYVEQQCRWYFFKLDIFC